MRSRHCHGSKYVVRLQIGLDAFRTHNRVALLGEQSLLTWAGSQMIFIVPVEVATESIPNA